MHNQIQKFRQNPVVLCAFRDRVFSNNEFPLQWLGAVNAAAVCDGPGCSWPGFHITHAASELQLPSHLSTT